MYLKAEEEFIDFLNRCKLKDSEVILCMCCSTVLGQEAAKGLETTSHKSSEELIRKKSSFLTKEVFLIDHIREEFIYHL